jgi:hypothetical protein
MENGAKHLPTAPATDIGKNGGPENRAPFNSQSSSDPRLVRLVRLLAKQAACDYLDEALGRDEHDWK